MKIEVEQHGTAKAVTDLSRLGDRASDLRRVSEKVRTIYRTSNKHRFDTNGVGHWKPLDPDTLVRGEDDRPNRETDQLYRALTAARAKGQIDIREPTEFRFGTDLPYAVYVNARRKLIDLSYSERQQIDKLISDYVASTRSM